MILSENVNFFQTNHKTYQLIKKNNIKRMAMKRILYAQVIKFRRKDLLFYAADKNKTESKFKF